MKPTLSIGIWSLVAVVAALLFTSPPQLVGQAAAPLASELEDEKLVTDITAQQGLILQNQARVDEKLAAIAEEVRQARLFAARGGNRR